MSFSQNQKNNVKRHGGGALGYRVAEFPPQARRGKTQISPQASQGGGVISVIMQTAA